MFIRDKNDVPFPIFQITFLDPLKVDDFLFQLVLAGRELFWRRQAPSVLANTREMRGRQDTLEEVTTSLSSRSDDECAFP